MLLLLLLRAKPHLSLHRFFLCGGFPLCIDHHILRLLLPKGAHDAFISDLGSQEVPIQRIAPRLRILCNEQSYV